MDPVPAADTVSNRNIADAIELATGMQMQADSESVWSRPQDVYSVTPSPGDTDTIPSMTGSVTDVDSYLAGGTSWVLASLGNGNGIEDANGYIQIMQGGST